MLHKYFVKPVVPPRTSRFLVIRAEGLEQFRRFDAIRHHGVTFVGIRTINT